MANEVRLQKYLADCGIASRRKSEEIILQGRIAVNGKIIAQLGEKVIPGKDKVFVDGKEIKQSRSMIYIMLNKPEGYITTAKEQFGRPYVMDLIKDVDARVFPVGRLDKDTSGLLLLTNDGDFTYEITHPSHTIKKTYVAEIKGVPTSESLAKFAKGLKIDDYITAPAKIRLLNKKNHSCIVEVVIHEGRNRQVRKMCSAIGHPVIKLKRVAIGKLDLDDLPEGKWRYLKSNEIKLIF